MNKMSRDIVCIFEIIYVAPYIIIYQIKKSVIEKYYYLSYIMLLLNHPEHRQFIVLQENTSNK